MHRKHESAIILVFIALAGCGEVPDPADAVSADATSVPDARLGDAAQVTDAYASSDVFQADVYQADVGFDAVTPDAGADVAALPDIPSPPDVPEPVIPRSEVEMTFMTANIGRAYARRSRVAEVVDGLADFMDRREPGFIGWQEIGGADPCGECEIEVIRERFEAPWSTERPLGYSERRGMERVHTPISAQRGGRANARAELGSPQWDGQSSTRFVTVVHYSTRNLSVINTHLIAGAWACGQPDQARRRDYWQRGWTTLRNAVQTEHERGRNVIVTGDLNRSAQSSSCNPGWNPGSLHENARRIAGAPTIDYIFAVPANRWRFFVARNNAGEQKRGSRAIGIDSHRAHWVAGSFVRD